MQEQKLTSIVHANALMSARIFNKRVRIIGLTRVQWELLYLLHEHDGQTQSALAEKLIMAKPPMGKMIDRLEVDGWVERRGDPIDRRVNLIFLTKKVIPFIGEVESIVDEIGDIATRGFSKSERKTFIRLLKTAHQNLSEETEATHD